MPFHFFRNSVWILLLAGLPQLLLADEPPPTAPRKTFLLFDWFHVKKGDLQVTLDPARVTPEGKKLIETYARDFQKKFDQSGHGFRPTDIPTGIRITQEQATRSQPWLVADKPWEKSATSPTVIVEDGRFRCWYSAELAGETRGTTVENGQVMEVSGSALAYAESVDGLTWTKPSLGILSFQGSKENNLVSPWNNGGSVFRDDHGPPSERYKCFHFDKLPEEDIKAHPESNARYGLFGVTSPDGLHWTLGKQPLVRYFCDTVNIAAWDPLLKKYVGYFRHHHSGRTISRSETDDFHNWPPPQPFLYAGPLDAPSDDYYTNCYTTYPGEPALRLLFPGIYHRGNDSVDIRLGISRDGRSFQWVSYTPVIPLGPVGEWDGGSLYAQPNLVQLTDGRLALPFDGYGNTHNEVWFKNFYGEAEYPTRSGIGWALWQDARLAGIEADEIGEFTINGSEFRGSRILINARTARGGAVDLELREKGKPLPGFSFQDSVPFNGDELWHPARFKDKTDLASLNGKWIEIAVRLRHAKIFACRLE